MKKKSMIAGAATTGFLVVAALTGCAATPGVVDEPTLAADSPAAATAEAPAAATTEAPATEFTELGTPTQLADWTVTVTDIAVTEDGVLVTYDAQYDGAEDFGNARVDLTFVLYDVEGTEHSINIEHDMETAGGSNSNGRYLPGETITREALFDDVDPALVSGGILHTEDLLMEDSADYAIA